MEETNGGVVVVCVTAGGIKTAGTAAGTEDTKGAAGAAVSQLSGGVRADR
jgi:hypothetical protein